MVHKMVHKNIDKNNASKWLLKTEAKGTIIRNKLSRSGTRSELRLSTYSTVLNTKTYEDGQKVAQQNSKHISHKK